jgi:hypothetical protein
MPRMEANENNLTSVLCGISGEYAAAAELTRRGLVASITLRNTRGIDILVSNADASKSAGVQVKTNQNGKRLWLLNRKAEDFHSRNLYYVFVCLKDPGTRPDFFVVPSKDVARYVTRSHRRWLARPGQGGQAHRDTPMRQFKDPDGKYLERWDLLKLS